MPDTALTAYQFTIEASITEWVEQKKTRTGSNKTRAAYEDTMHQFRQFLHRGDLDLLSNPIDIARIAALWANMRIGKIWVKPDRIWIETAKKRWRVRAASRENGGFPNHHLDDQL